MQLSSRLAKLPGMIQASAVMASESNLALLREAKLLDGITDAGPNDLLITLEGQSETAIAGALNEAQAAFDQKATTKSGGVKREAPRSLEMGLELEPNSNFALISTPGDYAASEALKVLHLGLNVMIFSDNVSSEDEIGLKRYARDNGLLVMGPGLRHRYTQRDSPWLRQCDQARRHRRRRRLGHRSTAGHLPLHRLGGASVRRSAQAAMILAARSAGLRYCKASRRWLQTKLRRSSS